MKFGLLGARLGHSLSPQIHQEVFRQLGIDATYELIEVPAEKLAEKMEKYLERRRNENRNYAPKAYQALSDARVERKGLTLVMISGGEAGTETAALLAGE